MNSAGYRIWRSIAGPILDEWAASKVELPRFTSVRLIDGIFVLDWSGEWRLSTAPTMNGRWSILENVVSSPFKVKPLEKASFFRLDPRR
jgi:hypothetical protein